MQFPKLGGKGVEHKDRTEAPTPDSGSDIIAEQKVTFAAAFLGLVASIGGFMFGYVRYVLLPPSHPSAPPPHLRPTCLAGHSVFTDPLFSSTVVRFPVSS